MAERANGAASNAVMEDTLSEIEWARHKAAELGANIPPCDETKYRIGLGVEGQVNGYYMHVGSERFMRRNDIARWWLDRYPAPGA